MWVYQIQSNKNMRERRSCLRESIRALESDIHHANTLGSVEMELCYSPTLVFLIEWMWQDCSRFDAFLNFLALFHIRVYVDGMPNATSEERKATIQQFYGFIYPMLKQVEGNLGEESLNGAETKKEQCSEEECGICMEIEVSKIVLPICGHSMCLACFNEWYAISPTCPFCRGSVASADLWVLTTDSDVIDAMTLTRDNLRRLHLYINNLPLLVSQHHDNLLMYNYMM